ncbi:hypothetical protein GE21DRAFT_1278007 [Neurospora crassa]|nr:hypothetical protein GE21DRAFT_1278007 [Neurospora crassa]
MALSVSCFDSMEKAAPEIVLIIATLGLLPYALNRRATIPRSDRMGSAVWPDPVYRQLNPC